MEDSSLKLILSKIEDLTKLVERNHLDNKEEHKQIIIRQDHTNGSVADVMEWKLKEESFIEDMHSNRKIIDKALDKYVAEEDTKIGLWRASLTQILGMGITVIASVIGGVFFADKFIK